MDPNDSPTESQPLMNGSMENCHRKKPAHTRYCLNNTRVLTLAILSGLARAAAPKKKSNRLQDTFPSALGSEQVFSWERR